MSENTNRLDRCATALSVHYDVRREDDWLTIAVSDSGGDDPEASEEFSRIQEIARAHGCRAEWTGDGDTWGDGSTTSDVRVEPAWPDLSPAVSIGGNAVEDTAALYDGDTPAQERRIVVRGGFERFRVGDAVTAPFMKSPRAPTGGEVKPLTIPGVVVATHADYVIVCYPQLGSLTVVFEPDHLTVTGQGDVAAALAEYAERVDR